MLNFLHARTITSNITGQVSGINLFTNPEELLTNWTFTNSVATANVASSPDDTATADRYAASMRLQANTPRRSYSLTAFETFDSGAVTFDTSNETFDTGSPVGTAQHLQVLCLSSQMDRNLLVSNLFLMMALLLSRISSSM